MVFLQSIVTPSHEKRLCSEVSLHSFSLSMMLQKDNLPQRSLKGKSVIILVREDMSWLTKVIKLSYVMLTMLVVNTGFFAFRERAVQELRKHGLSTSSLRTTSPLTSTRKSLSLSPERSILRSMDRTPDKTAEK